MSKKAIVRTSKTVILVFGLGFIGLLAGFYFSKIRTVEAETTVLDVPIAYTGEVAAGGYGLTWEEVHNPDPENVFLSDYGTTQQEAYTRFHSGKDAYHHYSNRRAFHTFDLSELNGNITSAVLYYKICGAFSQAPSDTFDFYLTPINDFSVEDPGDLYYSYSTTTAYATEHIFTDQIATCETEYRSINLNHVFINDFNGAIGHSFAIGYVFYRDFLDIEPTLDQVFYIGSDAYLEVEYMPTPACNDGIQNGDETGVDCGGSCQYSCVVPVILLYGINNDIEDIATTTTMLDNRIDNPIIPFDYAPGPCTFEYPFGCTTGSIIEYAGDLDRFVDTVLSVYNARYVDIVGYSMGGLISRWYIQYIDTNKVRNLIQIATPNHGAILYADQESWLREATYNTTSDRAGHVLHFSGISLDQLRRNSFFIWALNNTAYSSSTDYINEKVNYHVIGGKDGCWWDSMFIDGQDDCVVGEYDLKIKNNKVNGSTLYDFNHFNIRTGEEVLDHVANIINGNIPPLTSIPTLPENLTEPQTISFIQDHASGPDYNNVNIDSVNKVSFLLIARGEETSFSVESPDNIIYDATGDDQIKLVQIDNPLAGDWTLTASSTSADYQIFTIAETSTTLASDVPIQVVPGESILISANLTASSTPLIGAEVSAKIFDPDENEYNINLVDQGDGTYSSNFSQTSNDGIYDVRIYASTTIAGEIVNREAYTIFESVDNPDLTVSGFTASFDDANYELELGATIENLENVGANNFTLRFYDGEPGDIMSTMIKEIDFSLSALGQVEFTATTTPIAGNQDYYVIILKYDDEDDYTNNNALFSIYIPPRCSDGTNPNQCSLNKPMYCVDGELVNNCQLCGCPVNHKCSQSTNMCVYYHEEPPIPMSRM